MTSEDKSQQGFNEAMKTVFKLDNHNFSVFRINLHDNKLRIQGDFNVFYEEILAKLPKRDYFAQVAPQLGSFLFTRNI